MWVIALERNASLDILKLLMAFMVVALHAGFLSQVNALMSYLTVQGLFRIVVPVFLVINGFFFFSVVSADKHASWFKRIAILYVIWMTLYSVFWWQWTDDSWESFLNLSETLIFGYYHLWYLSGMLMGAGLLYCFRDASSAFLLTCIIVTFLLGVFIQYAGNYQWFHSVNVNEILTFTPLHRGPLLLSFPFLAIGFLIHKHAFHQSISWRAAIVLSVLGMLALLSESYTDFVLTHGQKGFDNFLSLIVVCPALFLLCMKMTTPFDSKKIALYSSAVFFVHLFFLNILRNETSLVGIKLMLPAIPLTLVAAFFLIKLNARWKYLL
ncbi:Acyltransferase family protein [Marinomonas spartinae]|uniref:Acyltransferase family protein n=1 Tax=Marinomonas spartinae TaxID=1792290 RepID=A0A1A8TUC3_9GAMM|nr:acyltransferase family protein [Marinomonas spartinae]SBS31904.1 Acyltransferase family protein [Marinomonas spartinae]SBS36795.1 Acyltransferase family protein [Marinomonas spartinae]